MEVEIENTKGDEEQRHPETVARSIVLKPIKKRLLTIHITVIHFHRTHRSLYQWNIFWLVFMSDIFVPFHLTIANATTKRQHITVEMKKFFNFLANDDNVQVQDWFFWMNSTKGRKKVRFIE